MKISILGLLYSLRFRVFYHIEKYEIKHTSLLHIFILFDFDFGTVKIVKVILYDYKTCQTVSSLAHPGVQNLKLSHDVKDD